MSALAAILADPAYHDYLSILKGARNGLVYGVKVRFPHALIMAILFGRGGWKSRLRAIFRATKQHALNLAKFVSLYKTFLLIQKRVNGGKERSSDTFIAGLISGYVVFGDRNAVNEQVMWLYPIAETDVLKGTDVLLSDRSLRMFTGCRVLHPSCDLPYAMASTASSAVKPVPPDAKHFSIFAALCWGAVMWLFTERGETIQPGMFSSMTYLYRDSNHWDSLRTLLWHNK
ncbi:Peroxisomal membrane protein 4 [Grifola frondosa]|uniref:Peroxisomal membrane protein 4 n=1 Tax=Grifola frondosa TaxID=5627 RepID=A0A1C7MSK9_GRIFR|nr:Peroxisomal membrane protein 4 [Grifola frondosa]